MIVMKRTIVVCWLVDQTKQWWLVLVLQWQLTQQRCVVACCSWRNASSWTWWHTFQRSFTTVFQTLVFVQLWWCQHVCQWFIELMQTFDPRVLSVSPLSVCDFVQLRWQQLAAVMLTFLSVVHWVSIDANLPSEGTERLTSLFIISVFVSADQNVAHGAGAAVLQLLLKLFQHVANLLLCSFLHFNFDFGKLFVCLAFQVLQHGFCGVACLCWTDHAEGSGAGKSVDEFLASVSRLLWEPSGTTFGGGDHQVRSGSQWWEKDGGHLGGVAKYHVVAPCEVFVLKFFEIFWCGAGAAK